MMKRLIAALITLVLMISSAGCVGVSFSGGMGGNGRESVQGEGEMTKVDFRCGDFSKLTIGLDFNKIRSNTSLKVYYTAEKSDKVTFEIQENLVQYITVSTDNGELEIDSDKSFEITDESKAPKLYISAPMLEELCIEGAATIEKADKIIADSFILEVRGVCSGTLELEVNELNADISGVSDITLNGTVGKATIDSSGVGNIQAFGLQIKETVVKNSGVGNIEVSCSDLLDAIASGVGVIQYKGNPNVTSRIDGMGAVTKVD